MKATTPSSKNSLRCLAVVLATTFACGSAMAQWQWVDATGRKVYSDTAPPRSIPDKSILKRPGVRAPTPNQDAAPATEPVAVAKPALDAQPSGVDPKLEAKRKAAEKAEEAKQQAELDKRNQARAENCERAKRTLATLESGTRIRTTNLKGEPQIMDDAARAVETKRVENIAKSDCGPAPASTVRSGAQSIP